MRVCTAEFPNEDDRYERAIEDIASHVQRTSPDLLVLPEMPFIPWIFCIEKSDLDQWKATIASHARWLDRLAKAIPTAIITSRPVNDNGKSLNQAFYLDRKRTLHPLRSKYYLPDDYPAVERVWFDEGDMPPGVFDILGHRIGVQLCSELMYAETPRLLAGDGVEIIIQSRATGDHPRWRAASVLGASTAGAYVIGSNRRSTDCDWFTGGSWIYSPSGQLLAESSQENPFATVDISQEALRSVRDQYPLTMFAHYRKLQA